MNTLKRFCFVVSFGYFFLAVLVQLKAWDAVFSQLLWFFPPLYLNDVFCGLLLIGFLTLFIGTIFIKHKEQEDASKSDENAEPAKRTLVRRVSIVVILNVAIIFFVFAANSSSGHGTPELLHDRRFVMS